MENTEVAVVENEVTDVATIGNNKLTGKETAGLVTVGALALVGGYTLIKGGIRLGKKAVKKIQESRAIQDAEEKVDNAVAEVKKTASKRRRKKDSEVENEEE